MERKNYIDAVVSYKDNVELKELIKAPYRKELIKAPYRKERIQKQSRWGNEEQTGKAEHVEAVKADSSYGAWKAARKLQEEAETNHKNHHRVDYSRDKNNTSWRSESIPQGSFNEPSHNSFKRDSARISRSRPENHGSQSSRFNAPGREAAISSSTSSSSSSAATTSSAVHNSRFKKVKYQSKV